MCPPLILPFYLYYYMSYNHFQVQIAVTHLICDTSPITHTKEDSKRKSMHLVNSIGTMRTSMSRIYLLKKLAMYVIPAVRYLELHCFL